MTAMRARRHLIPLASGCGRCCIAIWKHLATPVEVLPDPTGPIMPLMKAVERRQASATGPTGFIWRTVEFMPPRPRPSG
jgi:hypothetical protein